MSVNFKKERAFAYIPQPSRDERKLLIAIHTEGFYSHPNKTLQEKHYPLHLVCATYNECTPPIFSIGEEGKLAITEERYYAYKAPDSMHNLNPFSLDGFKIIQTAARMDIEIERKWRRESYHDLFRNCIPELAAILSRTVPIDEEDLAESA
jgi:hypothetical protein